MRDVLSMCQVAGSVGTSPWCRSQCLLDDPLGVVRLVLHEGETCAHELHALAVVLEVRAPRRRKLG